MAPTMERQQLLAQNSPEANRATAQDALRMGLAFGGADITKEERELWEKENELYRTRRFSEERLKGQSLSIPAGTRVKIRSLSTRYGEHPPFEGSQGTVVEPGSPEAGNPGSVFSRDVGPRGHEYVPVRQEGSPVWHWRHRDQLEVLPPLEKFPVGTKVQWEYRGKTWTGTVGEIPRSGHDKEYWHDQKKHIWIDNDVGPDEKPWGGWLPPEWLTKRKK